MSKNKITIYPLTKIFMIFVLGTMIVIEIPIFLEALMIILLGMLFFQNDNFITGIKVLVIFLLLLWIDNINLDFLGSAGNVIHSVCFIGRRFLLPVMGAKYANDSTPTGELLASLEKIKMPIEITIPIAVMFRFFPTLKEEFFHIKNAMRMRGIALNAKNIFCSPMNCMEYIFVPMLSSSSKLGDELAAAAHTKSIDDPCKKTRYKSTSISIWDILILTYLFAILIIGIWSRFQ
jgi:energy-coupling factor transport system permease protein